MGFALLIIVFEGCQKKCWRCNSILAIQAIYVKGTDTVDILFIEGTTSGIIGDSLSVQGYTRQTIGHIKLPTDFEMCETNKLKPYTDCSKIK